MRSLIVVFASLIVSTSFANTESECGIAKGLSIAAESMTAYGTNEHYYNNLEHASAVWGTKRRQTKELVKSIKLVAPSLPIKGGIILEETEILGSSLSNIWVPHLSLYKKGTDDIDSALRTFARMMKNLCR